MDKNTYEERLRELATRLEYIDAAYSIWDTLRDAYRREPDALSEYGHFFRLVMVMCLEHAQVSIYAAFDKDDRSAGIPRLIRAAKELNRVLDPYLTEQDFRELESICGQCRPTVDKISKHRHKVGHLNVTDKAEPYEISERLKLIERMKQVYQLLHSGIKGPNPIEGEGTYKFLIGKQAEVATQRLVQALSAPVNSHPLRGDRH